jgi:hypothetical protein
MALAGSARGEYACAEEIAAFHSQFGVLGRNRAHPPLPLPSPAPGVTVTALWLFTSPERRTGVPPRIALSYIHNVKELRHASRLPIRRRCPVVRMA